MAFAIRPGCDLADEIRRVGMAQAALAELTLDDAGNPGQAVHETRKCLKRMRALLRFARPGIRPARFAKFDRRIRDIARPLSAARDYQAMVELLGRLEQRYGSNWNATLTSGLRATFQGRQQRDEFTLKRLNRDTKEQTQKLHDRFRKLKLDGKALSVAEGIAPTYARSQKRMRRAFKLGDGTSFHAWRRDAQRHWRQMQLLTAAWPEEMGVRIAKAQALSQCLGDDHDIHVLLGHVRIVGPDLADWPELENFYDGCIEYQLGLRMAARNHGRLLFAENTDDFARRIARYWQAVSKRFGHGANIRAAAVPSEKVVPLEEARLASSDELPSAGLGD